MHLTILSVSLWEVDSEQSDSTILGNGYQETVRDYKPDEMLGPFRNDHHQYLSSQLSKNDLILVASFFRNNLAKLLVIAHQSAHRIQASPSFFFLPRF